MIAIFNCIVSGFWGFGVGERYASALTKISHNNKIIRRYGKINLKDYITSFIKG